MTPLKHPKTYRYELGHVWFRATTVGELRAYLEQFPSDMPVLATWEGTVHSLTAPKVIEFEGGDVLLFETEYDITDEQ